MEPRYKILGQYTSRNILEPLIFGGVCMRGLPKMMASHSFAQPWEQWQAVSMRADQKRSRVDS